ncbi:hypothetical protein [Microbacterium alcoholitolerans]|uniref:hypothetical protein n=1 Tax=unclassified Microbacterium TaxID=2609290 RepID=UPI003D16632B
MDWEHLFDDLEGQLAAEWEAERAALDAESERLRISKLTLHDRLRVMAASGSPVQLQLVDGSRRSASVRAVGADWIGIGSDDDSRLRIVPIPAIVSLGVDHGTLLSSLTAPTGEAGLRGRMSFGFVLRDIARRRTPVTVGLGSGDPMHGSIDRAGADHLDLALHDADEVRRARAVRGFRSIPFTAVAWVRLEGAADL